MTNEPERTVLYEEHKRLGAMLIDFHGWEMPVRYTSIPEEHQQVRERAGLFDLCHMGRLDISGPQAVLSCEVPSGSSSRSIPGRQKL